ncbi:hypothetical protein METP2_00227 [Methanosarcinales archaeon]|nr:hypothetical protein METP2_00227 [Methanosarcinales archaeon]
METEYNIDIEIDQDAGIVTIVKGGVGYTYTIEELEGKGILDNLQEAGAKMTVYSQKERFTAEEYLDLFGSD